MNKLTPRRFPRYGIDLPCRFRIDGTFQWTEASLVNLSRGGVCLKVKEPPERESKVQVEVVLLTETGEWQKRKLRAKVVWRRGMRAGLIFIGEKDTDETIAPSKGPRK